MPYKFYRVSDCKIERKKKNSNLCLEPSKLLSNFKLHRKNREILNFFLYIP